MHNTYYQGKHPGRNSPHQEMKQELDNWVRRLRSTEQVPEDTLTGVEQRGIHKAEFIARESAPSPQQSDDEGRWQDDGGEGG